MSVGENIAYFRKKLGLTQEMLSERIGVTAQAVSKWENGVTNPDISLLPRISEALGIGIGDLFDGSRERRAVGFGQLPDAAYDAVLSVFRRARCDFYGIDAVVTDARLREVRENISALGLRAVSVNESETGHGAVYLSDAFSYVDRGYGSRDSALLLDMRGAGNLLSALGDSDVRRVLKVIYEKRLSADTASDNVCISDDELTRAAGLSADVVYAAAQKLVSVRLLDAQESIENGCHVMSYTTRQAEDLAYVMAILRLAYAFTEDAVYETRMLCRADGQTNRPRRRQTTSLGSGRPTA